MTRLLYAQDALPVFRDRIYSAAAEDRYRSSAGPNAFRRFASHLYVPRITVTQLFNLREIV